MLEIKVFCRINQIIFQIGLWRELQKYVILKWILKGIGFGCLVLNKEIGLVVKNVDNKVIFDIGFSF